MAKGILYGVSTGPGDPELLTLKAINCIKAAPVIAAPRTGGVNTMALDIVKEVIDVSDKEILYLDFAMTKDKVVLSETHKAQAQQIKEFLKAGKDVAMLNIGDASLFGTFCYIRDLVVADGYESKVVAGVTSFSASAAALGKSLTNMGETLTIIPGSFDNVAGELDKPGTKVIMKSGKALPEILKLIEEKGLSDRASLVVNCGLDNEMICKDIKDYSEDKGYFVTIIIQ